MLVQSEKLVFTVNPFCTAINPAATTKLAQSGDIQQTAAKSAFSISADGTSVSVDGSTSGKKISLKAMTLSNGRQRSTTVSAIRLRSELQLSGV